MKPCAAFRIILLCLAASSIRAWHLSISPSDRLLNQRAGENFVVACRVHDYDGAASGISIEWLKDDKLLVSSGSTITIARPYSKQLMMNRPKVSDSGKYVCKVNIDGKEETIAADISFVVPPSFVDPQREQHPEDGKTAEITCRVEEANDIEIFWQFNGTAVDESSPRGYDFQENKQVLVIPNFDSLNDDGEYNCNIVQYSSFETLAITVTGYSRPEITVFDAPTFGYEAQSVQFKCGATGKPKPVSKWFKEDAAIESSDKFSIDEGLLVIESLDDSDAGEYTCVSTNELGEVKKSATLEVKMKPTIEKISDITKKEGESVEITCSYIGEGNLHAKFVNGEKEYTILSMSFNNDDEERETTEASEASEETTATTDSDDATEASDTKTTADDDSEEETTTANSVEATTDDSAEATTPESDNGDSAEESKRKKRSSQRVSLRADGNSLTLVLSSLSLNDAGNYACVVQNEAGASNRSMHLAITHPPQLTATSEAVVRSFDGNEISIFCEASAVPAATWTWTRDGSELEADGVDVIIDSTPEKSRVQLKTDDGEGNYGKYSCKADNGIGSDEASIEVIRVEVPAKPTDIDCKSLSYPTYGECIFSPNIYIEEASKPTELIYHIATIDMVMDSKFEWTDAESRILPYTGEKMRLKNLKPSSEYMIRVEARNEAGTSEMSDPVSLATTEAWAPKSPENVRMSCEEWCTVEWDAPEDHGSPVTSMKVTVVELNDGKEEGEEFNAVLDGEESSIRLTHIKPNTTYRVYIKAVNAIDESEAHIMEYLTDDSPVPSSSSITTAQILYVVGAALFILLIVVDLICYSANRCGILACLCINCCGRNPGERKSRDLEAGRGAEQNHLLDNSRR